MNKFLSVMSGLVLVSQAYAIPTTYFCQGTLPSEEESTNYTVRYVKNGESKSLVITAQAGEENITKTYTDAEVKVQAVNSLTTVNVTAKPEAVNDTESRVRSSSLLLPEIISTPGIDVAFKTVLLITDKRIAKGPEGAPIDPEGQLGLTGALSSTHAINLSCGMVMAAAR